MSDQSFTDIYLNILHDLSLLRGVHGELEAERDDLQAENATLRRERDDARAQGISDLNRIHRHQATIRRLEAKCAALEVDKAAMSASNAALRAGQGTWPEPDQLTTETLHADQITANTVTDLDAADPAPRLTVHALNTAPVGSTVSTSGKTWTKHDDGTWLRVSAFGQHERASEELIALGYARATLTRPERGEHDPPILPTEARRFALIRDEDETGVSGTGKVAEGVVYSDGHVSMRWIVGEHRSTVSYDNLEAVEAIHGHGGKTQVVVDDE